MDPDLGDTEPCRFATGTREIELTAVSTQTAVSSQVTSSAGRTRTPRRRIELASIRRDTIEHGGWREPEIVQIVHDLKNPLSTIALEMCLLGDKLGDDDHADLRRVVSRVTHNVEFLDRTVQDLLDSCAIDAGRFALERKPIELRALLEHVIDRVIATRDRGRVCLEAPCAMTVSIDDLRIERVIANLLQNALKYSPGGSRIVVRLDAVPDLARVSVIDAGPGLTLDETTYVFDRYRRASRARAFEGSGLGLYISKQIIGAHGGRIGVESVQGVGSRFFFELPIYPT